MVCSRGLRNTTRTGQSPGVKTIMPLHIIHSINWTTTLSGGDVDSTIKYEAEGKKDDTIRTLRYLRLYILKPAVGWGVSLWQLDVFGTYVYQ